MINNDSIVTAYDEHLTLVEWLQKVQTALKDAVLTGVTINKKGNATLSFVFTFEDGTTLETDDLILQQGESVASAYISNGNLHLVLSNGNDLDAGNMFNGNVVINGTLSMPILTSANDHIEAQKPVIEVMSGYSFTPFVVPNLSIETIYAGACKNGNKLTLVLFVKLTRSDAVTNPTPTLGRFIIPSAIGAKLYTFTAGNYQALDIRKIFATHNVLENNKELISYIAKNDNETIEFRLAYGQADLLPLNTDYYFRYEATFLLSENLANNG